MSFDLSHVKYENLNDYKLKLDKLDDILKNIIIQLTNETDNVSRTENLGGLKLKGKVTNKILSNNIDENIAGSIPRSLKGDECDKNSLSLKLSMIIDSPQILKALKTFSYESLDYGHQNIRHWLREEGQVDPMTINVHLVVMFRKRLLKKIQKLHNKNKDRYDEIIINKCHMSESNNDKTITNDLENTHKVICDTADFESNVFKSTDIGNKRKLLIFDLNKVLVYRKPFSHRFIVRPHLDHFMKEATKYFDLALWTSASKKHGTAICKRILQKSIRNKLVFSWYQSDCSIRSKRLDLQTFTESTQAHTKDSNSIYQQINENECSISKSSCKDRTAVIFAKDLDNVWKTFPSYGSENTLLVDDSYEKCSNNPYHCYVNVKAFTDADKDTDNELCMSGTFWYYLCQWRDYDGTLSNFVGEYGKYSHSCKNSHIKTVGSDNSIMRAEDLRLKYERMRCEQSSHSDIQPSASGQAGKRCYDDNEANIECGFPRKIPKFHDSCNDCNDFDNLMK